ncbi:MAG: beta galactosidase jelly roll domain-containing protein, partial [Cyclobacteriaceae bacterium]|nr:beta galactosidase jelly roll domain-containing protein [Cyclobacteriaceae bacterium]
MRKLFFVLAYLLVCSNIFSQTLQPGGLAGDKTIVLTPSKEENVKISGKSPYKIDYLGFKETDRSFEFSTTLPENWNWVAIFNAPLKGKKINTFYYDSWVATDQPKVASNGRRRNFEKDITFKIKSNAYHMAFQRKQAVENEVFMLVVSPAKQEVIIELNKEEFGVNRQLKYFMEENEAKFIHLVIPPAEYTNVTWKKENTPSTKVTLTHGWKFYKGDLPLAIQPDFDDSAWESVSLPHSFNTHELFDYRNYKDSLDVTQMIYRGIAWYRVKVFANEEWKNKYNKINFLGVNQIAEVFVNGISVGKHVGGYTDFHFDISKQLNYGKENTIAVKVDNRFNYDIPPHTADYNMQGGIYREVELLSLNPVFISKVHVFTPTVGYKNASVEVKTILNNKSTQPKKVTLITNLINPFNEIVASKLQDVIVPAGVKPTVNTEFKNVSYPLLWSPDYPHLYTVSTTLYEPSGTFQFNGKALDQRFDNIGFRFYQVDANKGLLFNGEPLKMKGVNFHQDFMHKGWAVEKNQKRPSNVW